MRFVYARSFQKRGEPIAHNRIAQRLAPRVIVRDGDKAGSHSRQKFPEYRPCSPFHLVPLDCRPVLPADGNPRYNIAAAVELPVYPAYLLFAVPGKPQDGNPNPLRGVPFSPLEYLLKRFPPLEWYDALHRTRITSLPSARRKRSISFFPSAGAA